MRYIYVTWHDENKESYSIAHDFGCDDYTAVDVARWMRTQLDDTIYPSFAFVEITKEQYDYYYKRKLTTKNFG
jgi:hypothetical protein